MEGGELRYAADGKLDGDGGPAILETLEGNGAAMTLDGIADHGETDAGTLGTFGAKKGLEGERLGLWTHADARIADLEFDPVLVVGGGNCGNGGIYFAPPVVIQGGMADIGRFVRRPG